MHRRLRAFTSPFISYFGTNSVGNDDTYIVKEVCVPYLCKFQDLRAKGGVG